MLPDLSLLNRNIARLRDEIRVQAREVHALAEAGLDFDGAARVLERLRRRLRDYLDRLSEAK